MNNVKESIGSWCGVCLSLFGTSMAVEKVEAIVGIVCSILGFLLSLIMTIIVPFIKKVKQAKEDGKVTIDEIEDIVKDTQENIDKFKDNINNKDNN